MKAGNTARVDGFLTVAPVSDFREGKIRRYFLQGREIAIVRVDGGFHAFHNRCTHADFQLHFGYIEDGLVHCPIHFAAFDIDTGEAVSGPYGIGALPVYEVRVHNDEVQVRLPPEEPA